MKKIIEKILTLIRKNEILKQSKAKQSKAKQSKAKQSKLLSCLGKKGGIAYFKQSPFIYLLERGGIC